MALNKTTLKTTIVSLLTDMLAKEENSIEEFATRLSDGIDSFVKSGTVNVNVTTTGTATNQSGSGTGTIS
ncbi:hypothetical protein [Flavobacterium degerlachei]|jgi:hypothetical protein|uniref:Uncharacterized protein n=1 Tax=Flavobacterium degerlachei TaxID=229203 RepID=A0A1H2Z468_9FLAO|nr:hypothetical protein [Flavobacterium degerlachei]SDX12127.1 hypothetical protein SAMN05444338_10776 [Flavobacterium degerlachei]